MCTGSKVRRREYEGREQADVGAGSVVGGPDLNSAV